MKKVLIGILCTIVLSGCNATKKVTYMQDIPLDTPIPVENYNEIKVRPGDMISITVSCKDPELATIFNVRDFSGNQQMNSSTIGSSSASAIGVRNNNSQYGSMPYIVNSQGDIDFPVFGALHVAGLNREQIADLIKKRIKEGKYIEDPKVNVMFLNLHYTVLGDISSPGEYSITDDKVTLFDALAKAGDLNITGRRDAIYLTRTENGKRTTTKLDIRNPEVFNSPVFYLQQDDVIYVEPNNVKAGQSAINENSFKSVGFWMSLASFLMSLSVFLFK